MAPAMTELHLTEDERDALTELANMGVGRAAANLSKMVAEPVRLSVPRTEIVSWDDAYRVIADRDGSGLVAVDQQFQGSFSGRALLIFPEANSLELVRAVVGGDLSLEELVDMEREALAEIGNVILNGCLATLANVLRQGLSMSLPVVLKGDSLRILGQPDDPAGKQQVLFLYIDFAVERRSIDGYIALLMDLPSLTALKALVQEFMGRVTR